MYIFHMISCPTPRVKHSLFNDNLYVIIIVVVVVVSSSSSSK